MNTYVICAIVGYCIASYVVSWAALYIAINWFTTSQYSREAKRILAWLPFIFSPITWWVSILICLLDARDYYGWSFKLFNFYLLGKD